MAIPGNDSSANKSTNVRSLLTTGIRAGITPLGRVAPELAAVLAEGLFLSPRRDARPAWEERLLANGRRSQVAYAGRPLPVWSWGEGPAILLVHGWEGRGSQLGAFVAPLVASGHRVVTLDLPGHGDAPSARVSVMDFARVLAGVQGRLGPLHGVIAHSVGAAATTFAYALTPFAERLALIAGPRGPRRFFTGFSRYLGLEDAVSKAVERRLESRYGVGLDDIDVIDFAPFVRARTLVIHDRADKVVPFANGEALATALPRGELLATEGLGHHRILNAPEIVAAAVRFVASPDARSLEAALSAELFHRDLRAA